MGIYTSMEKMANRLGQLSLGLPSLVPEVTGVAVVAILKILQRPSLEMDREVAVPGLPTEEPAEGAQDIFLMVR